MTAKRQVRRQVTSVADLQAGDTAHFESDTMTVLGIVIDVRHAEKTAQVRAFGHDVWIDLEYFTTGARTVEYDDERQAVAHWLDRNYGPSLHAAGHRGHDWLAAADDLLEVAHAARPAAPSTPATPAVDVRTSEGATGAPGGAGEVGGRTLGDDIGELLTDCTGDPGVIARLAERADALEEERENLETTVRMDQEYRLRLEAAVTSARAAHEGERRALLAANQTIKRVRDLPGLAFTGRIAVEDVWAALDGTQ